MFIPGLRRLLLVGFKPRGETALPRADTGARAALDRGSRTRSLEDEAHQDDSCSIRSARRAPNSLARSVLQSSPSRRLSCARSYRQTDMRDRLNNLLQAVFHTGLPLFLVVLLLILNALLSQSGALVR